MNSDYRVKIVYPLVYLNVMNMFHLYELKQIYDLLTIFSLKKAFKLVANFDNHTINKNFKFGVIYMKKGQV